MSVQCVLLEQQSSNANLELQGIEILSPPTKTVYSEGDAFDSTGMIVVGKYKVGDNIIQSVLTNYTIAPEVFSADDNLVTITYAEGLQAFNVTLQITVNVPEVRFRISKMPNKTEYTFGDAVDLTGLEIEAIFKDGTSRIVYTQDSLEGTTSDMQMSALAQQYDNFSFEAHSGEGTMVEEGNSWNDMADAFPLEEEFPFNIYFTWTEGETSSDAPSAEEEATPNGTPASGSEVAEEETGEEIPAAPEDAALYADGAMDEATSSEEVEEDEEIEGIIEAIEIDAHLHFPVIVHRCPVTPPIYTGTKIYTYSPSNTIVNLDQANDWSMDTILTNSKQYFTSGKPFTITPKTIDTTQIGQTTITVQVFDTFIFPNGTQTDTSQVITVNKAARTLTLDPSTVTISDQGDTYVTLSYAHSDTFAQEIEITNDDNLQIIGIRNPPSQYTSMLAVSPLNGADLYNQQVTIKLLESDKYLECSAILTVSTNYPFYWGDENAEGDATWWKRLQSNLNKMTTAEQAALVGKQKKVILTSPVLGTTEHMVRCIGANQDGENSLTFQTSNCLAQTTKWSTNTQSTSDTTSARWSDSACKTRQECQNYYNAFPGKAYIKQVEKLTSTACNDVRDNIADAITVDYVWLPSEQEMGLDRGSPSRLESTRSVTNTGYSYYTDGSKRNKNLGDGTTKGVLYWCRSRYFRASFPYRVIYCANNFVGGGGGTDSYAFWNDYGFSPAFIIQGSTVAVGS